MANALLTVMVFLKAKFLSKSRIYFCYLKNTLLSFAMAFSQACAWKTDDLLSKPDNYPFLLGLSRAENPLPMSFSGTIILPISVCPGV